MEAVPNQLILDLSRLVYTAWRRTPTGIARVELAYAKHLISTSGERLTFVVLDAFGRIGVVRNKTAGAFVSEIERYWRADIRSRRRSVAIALRALLIHIELLFQLHGGLIRFVKRHRGRSIYIIVSHLHMDRPTLIERLKSSGRLKIVYFVHDIIPIVFPEYCPPTELSRDRRRMETAAKFADAIVVNSRDTAEAYCKTFTNGRQPPSLVIAPLGVSLPSALPRGNERESAGRPYFVAVGTIEPRKNHLLLLNVWRNLRRELGKDAPRLILVGVRGWENENVVDMLERSPSLRGFVEERRRASDQELTQILAGARALLMPSFAEGYGLPLAEALTLSVPVLCSDIPSLREVGGDIPEYIDPLDGPKWRSLILEYLTQASVQRHAQLTRLAAWLPPTWEDHFRRFSALLGQLEAGS